MSNVLAPNPYKIFNHKLKVFFRELDKTFNDMWFTKAMLATYKITKTMSKKLPHKFFHEWYYIKYYSYVLKRDDTIFFSDTFVPPRMYASIAQALKDTWVHLDDANKNIIWDHLLVLCILNEKCVEYRAAKKQPPIDTLTVHEIKDVEGEDV